MASLRQIRRRMKSIDSIHEITKAMEMIAAFRYKRAETRWSKSKNYLVEMESLVSRLSAAAEDLSHPLFEDRKIQKKALIVMTGDKGLCGAYNANILRMASQWLKDNKDFEASLVPVAKIGHEFFKKRQIPFLRAYPEKTTADLLLAKKMTAELTGDYLNKKVDSIEVLYTPYKAGGPGQNRIQPFLSLSYLKNSGKKETAPLDYIFEPDFNGVFLSLIARYLEGKMYVMLLESLTSEHSARRIAMKQATENAEEVLDNLRLLRNKTRQATITRELSEIVSGASVLV